MNFFVKDCFFLVLRLTFAVKKLYNNVGMNNTLYGYRVKREFGGGFSYEYGKNVAKKRTAI